MTTRDFLIVGGDIAGVSAAARLAARGRTVPLEAGSAFGYRSSGRSATYYHFGIGKSAMRGLGVTAGIMPRERLRHGA